MISTPLCISLMAGRAEGQDEPTATELAFADAGLGGVGLLPSQMTLLQGARLEPLYEPPVGQLLPAVTARFHSQTPGETIAAVVALGLSPAGHGIVRCTGGPGRAPQLEEETIAQVTSAFQARGIALKEIHTASAEQTIEEQGCVIAAAVLWDDEREPDETRWVVETWTPHMQCRFRIRDRLFQQRSPFQHVEIVETLEFGRMLLLDHTAQTTERDQWAYHEMLAHVPMYTHPEPHRVLIIGGGDGGLLRAVLDHPTVERAVQVEIDRLVVEASKAHLPAISEGAFEDPRAEVVFEDAFTYLGRVDEEFDVALLDTTDPVGPAQRLFTAEFYGRVLAVLGDRGVASAQSGSPWFQPDVVARTVAAMRAVFPVVRPYIGNVPTYPGGLWTFMLGSRGRDPLSVDPSELRRRFKALQHETRYYTPEIYRTAFALPPFVASLLESRGVRRFHV